MKDFGFGKQSLEKAINEEIDELIDSFKASKVKSKFEIKFYNDFQGKDFFLQADFNIPIINILWQLLAGYRFTNDEEHEEGLKAVESVTELFAQGMANSFLPFKLQKVKLL